MSGSAVTPSSRNVQVLLIQFYFLPSSKLAHIFKCCCRREFKMIKINASFVFSEKLSTILKMTNKMIALSPLNHSFCNSPFMIDAIDGLRAPDLNRPDKHFSLPHSMKPNCTFKIFLAISQNKFHHDEGKENYVSKNAAAEDT